MERFIFTRSYTVLLPKALPKMGRRRRFFFHLLERSGNKASFCIRTKGNEDVIPAIIKREGDKEIAAISYQGVDFILTADEYISKGYPFTEEGMRERMDDHLKDGYLHTIYNREEINNSRTCACISCMRFFKPDEIEAYADKGETGICPYCGVDAIIGDASGVKMADLTGPVS